MCGVGVGWACVCQLGGWCALRAGLVFGGELFTYELSEEVLHLMQGGFSPEVFRPANSLTYRARCLGLM